MGSTALEIVNDIDQLQYLIEKKSIAVQEIIRSMSYEYFETILTEDSMDKGNKNYIYAKKLIEGSGRLGTIIDFIRDVLTEIIEISDATCQEAERIIALQRELKQNRINPSHEESGE